MIGTRLAHYEVTSHLGTGGMGEVYQATDSKLGRSVAIKLLPEAFTHDADRAARFEREARVLASLNHPNIATIHGVEESGGRKFLVMELVTGETLAEKIRRGAIPLEESLGIATQIAEALEAAHEKGVIHRDLKPANIKVTPEGKVKVLDFGLAKAFAGETANASLSNSPTMSHMATQQGLILGTAAYMSPEQAKGKEVDRRTDIFAFGAVLYEMLTGHQAFGGDDVSDILSRVLQREPDWALLPVETPSGIRKLLRRCLEKNMKNRRRDAGEVRLNIEEALAEPETVPVNVAAPQKRSLMPWAAVAVLVLAAGVAGWGWWKASRPVPHPMMRFDVDMGPLAVQAPLASAVLSPDGMQVAYMGRIPEGGNGIYLRRLDQPEGHLLVPIVGSMSAAFSPDGQWLAFNLGGAIQKVSTQGGAAVTLGKAAVLGMTWSEDGSIYVGTTGGLFRVQEARSPGLLPSPGAALIPHALPGGKAILISERSETDSAVAGGADALDIAVLTVATGARKRLVKGGYQPGYVAAPDGDGGYLLYVNQQTLFAAPFDLGTLEVRGTAIPLLADLGADPTTGGQYSVSRNGTLAYLRNADAGATAFPMMEMDSTGATTPVLAARATYFSPRYSPDGKKIAYVMDSEVWVYDVERRVPTQLTFSKTRKSELAWAPDGKHILFGTARELLWIRAAGGGQPQRLLEQKLGVRVFSTAPDGRVAFAEANTARGLATVRLDLSDPENPKAGKPEPFQDPQASRVDAAFSPDGKFMALVETDTEELFVTPFPGPGGKWKISGSGGKFPAWSRTGRQLFFLGGDDRIMVADYSVQGDTFTASIPRVWSPTRVRRLGVTGNFDVSPDGKHVVMFPSEAPAAAPGNLHITFGLNLADELKRRFSAAAK